MNDETNAPKITWVDEEQEESTELDDAALVQRAHECYRLGVDYSNVWRAASLEDLSFLSGEQWDSNIKAIRDSQRRPILTVNRLPQFVRQVTNEQRQSKPSVTVNPCDATGDVDTALVLQGIIRNIEYTSNASVAYATGGESAARTGLGYWDVTAEYENERSFDQRLTIQQIDDAHSIVMDPAARELAGDDARWVIISTDISDSEWKSKYPDRERPQPGGWEALGDTAASWVAQEGVRIHEYRWIDERPDELFNLAEASPVLLEALKLHDIDTSAGGVLASELGPEFAAKMREAKMECRPTVRRKACWAKIAGGEVLERGELAGRYLQVVRVVGTKIKIDGKTIYEGIIRHAKDTQRALNYYVSAETEAIALAPKAPWLVAEGQIEGYETQWENANQKPQAVLTYKPSSLAGEQVPPPQRVMAEANIAAITTARQNAGEDLSEVTGIYPTQFGAPAPEQSGVAIQRRVQQSNVSNFHFQDNFAEAIKYTGRILVDLIPVIYSGPRIMRILGEDGVTPEMVPVNGAQGTYKGEPATRQDGTPRIRLDLGRYDVAVSMGPSYMSRRQEAAQQMMELLRVNPQISPIISDLLVRSLDIPNGDVIADRLQKLLPPEIRPPDNKTPPPQVMAQQLQQQGQMLQKLTERLHQLSHVLETEEVAHRSKERIALINAQTELVKVAATLQSKEAQAMLDRTQQLVLAQLEKDNEPVPGEEEPDQPQGASNGVTRPVAVRGAGQPGNGAPGGESGNGGAGGQPGNGTGGLGGNGQA